MLHNTQPAHTQPSLASRTSIIDPCAHAVRCVVCGVCGCARVRVWVCGNVRGCTAALCRYVSLLPVFIGFGLGVVILTRRELGTIVLLLGLIIDERVNAVLKHVIAQPRPLRAFESMEGGGAAAASASASAASRVWGEHGMPSSHTQFMVFFAVYLSLWVGLRLRPRPTALCGPRATAALQGGVIFVLFFLAAAVGVSRVYLQYHTVPQVVCGAAVGALTGAGWFGVMATVLAPTFPRVEAWWVSRLLLLRDSSPIDDVFLLEYDAVATSKKRALKTA